MPDDGLDLGSELLGRREALQALHVLAGPHGQLALEGTDGALGHLQGLGGAVDLGLGRSQLVLQGGPPLFDRGELDAVLLRSHVGVIVVGFVRVGQRVRQEEVARRVVQGHADRVDPDRGEGVDQRCPQRLGDRPMGPEEREDVVAGIDAEEVGDLVEQPGALGDEVVDLGARADWRCSSASRASLASKCSRSAAGRAGLLAAERPPVRTTSR